MGRTSHFVEEVISVPWHYTYLLLGCMVDLGALVVYWVRADLRRPIIAAGVIGGGLEAISEVWYLHDYWRPLTLWVWPTPEDLLYGFGTTALAVCAVPFWFRCRYVPLANTPARKKWVIVPLAAFGIGMSCVGRTHFLPSIWAATLLFMTVGSVACVIRRDLLRIGMIGGLIMGLVATIGYGIGLNFVIDGAAFLDHVLLIAGTPWDIRILGNVPLDEVAWNIMRGWCVAVLYPLLTAQQLIPQRAKHRK